MGEPPRNKGQDARRCRIRQRPERKLSPDRCGLPGKPAGDATFGGYIRISTPDKTKLKELWSILHALHPELTDFAAACLSR
jgi:hypothetical protein